MADIVKNGKVVSTVIYNKNGDYVDYFAVSEYSLFIRYCYVVDQKAYSSLPENDSTLIFIGSNPILKEKGIIVPYEKFEDDTVYILVKGNTVVLDGGKRGKLYAVYEFLERFLNVRFYSPEKCLTPYTENVTVEDMEYIYTPQIKYRQTYSFDMRMSRDYYIRLRNNADGVTMALHNFGGAVAWASPSSHTTFEKFLVPEDETVGFKKHPEYYSYLEKYGKRVGRHHYDFGVEWGEGDICWSNEEVRDIIFEKLKKWILLEDTAEIFSVSQNDWPEHCECENCKKLAYKYSPDDKPRYSGLVVDALNSIARRIKQWQDSDETLKKRNIMIETFAYQYSCDPPVNIKVEDNVLIRLCTHEGCFYHALNDPNCHVNRIFCKQLQGWQKIAKNIYIWHYSNNHCMYMSYNTLLRTNQENIKFFAENNVVGVFNEYCDAASRVGNLFLVREYLYGKLLWNPYIDYEKEYKQAMEFFYEEGAPYLMEIEDLYWNCCSKFENYHPREAYTILPEHYPQEFLDKATQLYETAIQKAFKEETKLAIKKEYIILKWVKMFLHKGENMDEMTAVLEEMKSLGITEKEFPRLRSFIDHFYNGIPNDLYLPEIEDRNRKADMQKLMELLYI